MEGESTKFIPGIRIPAALTVLTEASGQEKPETSRGGVIKIDQCVRACHTAVIFHATGQG